MAAHRGSSSKWFFSREQLETTPSRRCGLEPDRELSYRQQAANLIQDMGQRLNVSQLTINTAIVYMHRFYMYHSFTKFHRNHRPTVIACVCIHLACKWSNWEIPVSTDSKHWWEYVDNSVTLELLDELTHEFLQILEKTPSKLKRIRNWRATQAAKKPKTDGASSESSSFPGPSLVQDHLMVDAISGVTANATFSKPSTSLPISLQASGLPLDHIATTVQGTSYTFTAPSDWPQDQARSDPYVFKQLPLLPHRPDKCAEFTAVKHEHKASKQQSSVYLPPPASQPQKMSLEKYKEKHAAELAAQKRRQEQPSTEPEVRDSYGSSGQVEHRKPQQPYAHEQQGGSSSSTFISSPLKMKLPITGQEKVQGEKREKGSSLKLRLPVQAEKSGTSKEELKMKIKVSSERHSSSDEGASKSKHSSPLVSKEKHRHHHKHGYTNPHQRSGSTIKSPVTLGSESGQGSSSLHKRTHTDGSHNHRSKKSKGSKPATAGGQGFPGEPWS